MRVAYTTILSAALAASALAFPFRGANQKRDDAVEIVTECTTIHVTEYATSGPSPSPEPPVVKPNSDVDAPAPTGDYTKYRSKSRRPRPTSTSAPETSPPPPAVTPPIESPVPTSKEPAAAPTTSPAPAPSSPAPSGGSFESEVLAAHNDKRALHGVPALTYDKTLADYAAGVSATCKFEHSHGPYGENLAAGYASAAEAIKAWYDEEKLYNYASGDFSSATGHFTQLVWKSTTKVGCGVKACNGAGGTPGEFLTCNYDTGNVIGQFQANVLPPV
ncbi:unnamed protein product [Tuber aestivum]|uniref:SCP domain-containing protein n=1 Tax=Tuber aestivum TaxID=59557 RepID=A0A292PUT4_9PEZI|nr:unnamed protein product [Tuber aestivum]